MVVVKREFFGSPGAAESPLPVASADSVPNWEKALPHSLELGAFGGRVTVLVASDIECPACRAFHRSLRRHLAPGDTSVSVRFLHFPLRQHRFAPSAAAFVECAARQGKVEAALDLLFEKQDSLGLKEWESFASEAGLGTGRSIKSCMTSAAVAARVEEAREAGERLGVTFTPTLIVNGWRIPQVPSHAQLGSILAQAAAGDRPSLTLPLQESVARQPVPFNIP
jgi:protein-disulfide isomerase